MRTAKYKVNIQVKRGLGFPLSRNAIREVIVRTLQKAGDDEPVEVDCVITDDPTIRKLNKAYRGIDNATDVLSFGLSSRNSPVNYIEFPLDPGAASNLGEIIISYPRAMEQAPEHDNTVEQELMLLIVHGTLHLLGYDHEDNNDARKMRAQEKDIITSLEGTAERH